MVLTLSQFWPHFGFGSFSYFWSHFDFGLILALSCFWLLPGFGSYLVLALFRIFGFYNVSDFGCFHSFDFSALFHKIGSAA